VGARRLRFVRPELGPLTIGLLVLAEGLLWLLARPTGEPGGSYFGQFLGAEAVLLLAIGLVLISTLPWVEVWFDGIDQAAIWHRRVAITGLALVLPHILLASNPARGALGGPLALIGAIGMLMLVLWAILPRWQSVVPRPLRGAVVALRGAPVVRDVRRIFGGYERWRALHRTTGVFVAAGFVHGILDATPFEAAPALRWSYLVSGGIGLAFYAYRELLAGRFLSLHDFQVAEVRTIGDGLTEIVLQPLGRPMEFAPGQFAMVYLEGKDGWHRHPFTITSPPHEQLVRFAVKARGDYTSRLRELIEPGMPAVLGGPHGRFDYRRGTSRQLWVAGGVGIAPFLSWLRALDGGPAPRVDLFYSADGEAPYADEIRTIAAGHASVRAHIVDSGVDGRLSPDEALAATGAPPGELSVFMCGPPGMLRTFQASFQALGVSPRRIHREYFDWR
jgi:predicted ferric reductase